MLSSGLTCCMNNACSLLCEHVALYMQALIEAWSGYTAICTRVYTQAVTDASCPCSSKPDTQHNDFGVKREGIWYDGCRPQLQQPFCELPASEVFTQRPCVPLYEQGARSMWFGLDFLKCFSITAVQESQTHSDFRFLCPIDRIYLLLVFVTSPTAKGIDV